MGKLLAYFGRDLAEAFPEGKDAADQLVPVADFGSWLKNLRVRKGLKQVELARVLKVSKVSIRHYESGFCKPGLAVRNRLRRAFKLHGEFDRFL